MPMTDRAKKRPSRPAGPAGSPVKVATIHRAGQWLSIRPAFEGILGPLATRVHVAAVHPNHGFQAATRAEPLAWIEGQHTDPHHVVPAGLKTVAVGLLERHGVVVERDLVPVPPQFVPSAPVLATSGLIDRSIVEFVAAHERGLVRVGDGVSVAWLLAQVHRAFPDAKIAVAAARREDVARLGRELRPMASASRWSAGDDPLDDAGPLVVSTYLGLAYAIHKVDLLFCLDARESFGKDALFAIGHAVRARLFGLTRGDRLRAPLDRDRAWSLYGFDVLEVPAHGRAGRPVSVALARITGGPRPAGDGVVALKREGIWAHPVRNRRVARLALALARGGSDLAAEGVNVAAMPKLDSPGVVVLVEGVEHAEALAKALPGWAVLAGPHAGPAASTGSPTAIPVRAIATLDGLAAIDLDMVDILIRADGGVDVPPTLACGFSMPYPGGRPLHLVDFDDRHHPRLRRRSAGRRARYRDLGWRIAGEAAPTPLGRFLATRSGAAR